MSLTSAGLSIPTVEDLIRDIADEARAKIHPAIDIESSDTVEGQMTGIYASALREAYEAILASYHGRDPDAAEGVQLDWIGALTGSLRRAATKTLVRSVTVNLDAGQSFNAGDLVAHVEDLPDRIFENRTTVASTTAGNYTVDFVAQVTGPVVCPATKLNNIASPVSGWNSVSNPTDGILGKDIEQDPAYAARRAAEVQGAGSGPLGSLVAVVSKLDGIDSVRAYENVKAFRDSVTGLPANSFEVVVSLADENPATDDEIAAAILSKYPAGITSYGSNYADVEDSIGELRRVYFSKANNALVWLTINLIQTKSSEFGADGAALLKLALVAHALTEQRSGDPVYANEYLALAQNFPGVKTVTSALVGFSNPPILGTLPVTLRQRARLDTSRITVSYS